ncbi:HET-domain-containing protein [Hyaloscypha hepaticicola]|uniref:HET-domain-containing protein n=1 Tax=Hyaloscypha hepaticicola TaxID=2082293 RepID=A0A2J6PHY2_9HELO|nr:HET-domain-containing protein [Hyaloscypha hepaticicola]
MTALPVLPTFDIVKLYHGSYKLCDVCEKLDLQEIFRPSNPKKMEHPKSFILHDFWVTSRYCLLCGLLLQSLRKTPEYTRICDKRESGWVCRVISREWGRSVFNDTSNHSVSCQMQPGLVRRTQIQSPDTFQYLTDYGIQVLADENEWRESHRLSLGRWMNLAKADIGLLRNWITCCEKHHGDACTPIPWNAQLEIDFRVIDVKRRCLVQAPPLCTYLALSYVWGDSKKVKHLKLTKETAIWMYNQYSLSEGNQCIPKTIRDAITLVHELGENYVWIDALCIQQDDKFDIESQIPYMGRIYSGAKCTIVAGSGSDAWAGLTGAGHTPEPRSNKQYCATIQGLRLVTIQQHYQNWRNRSVWDTRGWTLQEKALSKKSMIFADDQVFFHCQRALWYEDTILENMDTNIVFRNRDIDHYNAGSVFTSYEALVIHFTSRSFGFQGDVLHAFRGLESLLQHRWIPPGGVSFSSGFVWGLPESVFDWGLGWTFPYHLPDRRRSIFPSWSWAGWNYEGIGYCVGFGRFAKTRRELAWHRRDPSSSKWLPINSSGLGDLSDQPSRSEKGSSSHWNPNNSTSSIHLFQTNTLYGTLEHILQVWTSTVRLPVDRSGSQYKINDKALPDPEQGNEVMAVRNPHTNIPIGQVNLSLKWRACQPDNLDFIVLSRCLKDTSLPHKHGLFVMMIEWKHGIAYRVQMLEQPIWEEIWIQLKPEWKLISLG